MNILDVWFLFFRAILYLWVSMCYVFLALGSSCWTYHLEKDKYRAWFSLSLFFFSLFVGNLLALFTHCGEWVQTFFHWTLTPILVVIVVINTRQVIKEEKTILHRVEERNIHHENACN